MNVFLIDLCHHWFGYLKNKEFVELVKFISNLFRIKNELLNVLSK